MHADEFKILDVLKQPKRFIVPLYQRQYKWHDERDGGRTAMFWRDVVSKANDVLNKSAKFEHYMGALILSPSDNSASFGRLEQMQVVDGQQRLTTFLILIAAIKEVALALNFEDIVDQCDDSLFVKPGPKDIDENAKYKLIPTYVDANVFISLLELRHSDIRLKFSNLYYHGRIPKNTQFRALRAYEYFISQIRVFISTGSADDIDFDIDNDDANETTDHDNQELKHQRLSAVLEALVFHMKLIVITLNENDDAQVIFETLNSAGQPLLAMDLVRNNIFHRAEFQFRKVNDPQKSIENLYTEVWLPFDAQWWQQDAPNARPTRPRLDHFLSHVLSAETGERSTVRELYAEYRAWVAPKGNARFSDVLDELNTLLKYVPIYEALEGRNSVSDNVNLNFAGQIHWIGERLRIWQNTTLYPALFQIMSSTLDDDEIWAIVKLFDSYLTRRSLCNLTSKNLNQIFQRLTNTINQNGCNLISIKEFFTRLTADTNKFPSDKELINALLDQSVYNNVPSRILQEVFWEIELSMRGAKTEATAKPAFLTVEHVLPQNWETNWPLLDENNQLVDDDDDNYYDLWSRKENLLHTIGNLTVVTKYLNSEMKNNAFDKKKVSLWDNSNLTLNKRIYELSTWDEEIILKRSKDLGEIITKIWPQLVL